MNDSEIGGDRDIDKMGYNWENLQQMDFDQAYDMCYNIQSKECDMIDDLQKVQILNSQYCPNIDHFEHKRWEATGYGEAVEEQEELRGFDQFFSHTETDALERFLDSLASTKNTSKSVEEDQYNFNSLKFLPTPPEKSLSPIQAPPDIKGRFDEPFQITKVCGDDQSCSLPTPDSTRKSSTSLPKETALFNSQMSDDSELPESGNKRRRISTKQLLTTDQKKFNHSHSEQKRRQLCKIAYERCVNLVVNFEEFSKNPPCPKKKRSKRRQFNKDGLPNLSKHHVLIKISREISKIKSKNEELKKLLESN